MYRDVHYQVRSPGGLSESFDIKWGYTKVAH